MSVSDDVGNLFRRFGGDAGQYQEVTRDDDAKHAALRWPLLNALDIVHTEPVPDAGRPMPPAASFAARVEPVAKTSAASATQSALANAAPAASESTGPSRPPLFARGHRHASMPPPVVAPAQRGASRFSAPPASTPAAANAATLPARLAAEPPKSVAAAPAAAPVPATQAPFAPSAPHPSRDAAQLRPAQPVQAVPFLSGRETFARPPFNNPVAERPRVAPPAAGPQQGGSILSGLFGGRSTPQPEVRSNVPSKDLSTLFARLSHGSSVPARSLRDTFRSRFKADGDA